MNTAISERSGLAIANGLFECSRCGAWVSEGDFVPQFVCDNCFTPPRRQFTYLTNTAPLPNDPPIRKVPQ